MSNESSQSKPIILFFSEKIDRRHALKIGAKGLGMASLASTIGIVGKLSQPIQRVAQAAPTTLPDIQFDIASFLPQAITIDDGAGPLLVNMGPIYTTYLTIQLTRLPNTQDFQTWQNALNTIESIYQFHPANGLFTFVSYGVPYFNRLPATVVNSHIPRLLSNTDRLAVEEVVPMPTDVSPQNPGIVKPHFNVPVRIENNDMLVTFRSDHLDYITDVINWLQGSNVLRGNSNPSPAFQGLFNFTSKRVQFTQRGMPRAVADKFNLPYNALLNPSSPMWMGFADQQVNATGPASIVTFQGNSSAVFTTCKAGDYFFNGAAQVFSHVILDLAQFYKLSYTERMQLMFRPNSLPAKPNAGDPTNGPAFAANNFLGSNDASQGAQQFGIIGHTSAIQRVSRAPDGTPMHIRIDGPGFDNMDVPDGSNQPKLNFSAFLPASAVAALVRRTQASIDLTQQFNIPQQHDGLELFSTATRRQMFLIPPRVHRAFPLLELS
jgi:hypothetical protein